MRRKSLRKCLALSILILLLSAIMYSSVLFQNSQSSEKSMDIRDTRKISSNGTNSHQAVFPSYLSPNRNAFAGHLQSPLKTTSNSHQLQHLSPSPSQSAPNDQSHDQPLSQSPSFPPTSHPLSHPPSSSKRLAFQQPNCEKPHCAEFLSRADENRQKACNMEVFKNNRDVHPKQLQSMILENDCNFMDGKGRAPVALVSAEGSGNTWVRGLLEKATGICTGFNFCDYIMRMKGFIGDNINSGSVLVVKTHMDKPQWIGNTKIFNRFEAKYGSAIFLLRNPYDSLIAEWNRRLTNDIMIKRKMPHNESHTNVAPKEIWCESPLESDS